MSILKLFKKVWTFQSYLNRNDEITSKLNPSYYYKIDVFGLNACFVYRYLKEKYYEIKYIDFDDNSVDFQYIPKDSPRLNRDAYLLLENGNYQYYNRASVINDNLVLYVIDMIEIRVEILNSDEFFEMEITPIFAYSMIHGEVLERYSNVSILSIQDNEGNIIDQSDFNKYIYLTVIVETKSV